MATTPYKPVWWGEEPINPDKLNQMANNEQWLFENAPRMYYNAHSLKKSSGIKILAGTGVVPASSGRLSSATIYFGTFFAQGCRPIVVASPVKNTARTRYLTMVGGIGTTYPDHRGCMVHLTTDEYSAAYNYHAASVPVHYIAIGW